MKPILAAALSALALAGCAVCAEDYGQGYADFNGREDFNEREDYVAAPPRLWPKPPTIERLTLPVEDVGPERKSKSQSQ